MGLIPTNVVVALIVVGFCSVSEAGIARRALNKQIPHFEPLRIPEHHIFRRSLTEKSDRRHVNEFKLPIRSFNKSLTLNLKPATHLFKEGGVPWHHVDEEGTRSTKLLTSHGFYSGHVDGSENHFAFAHVHVDKGGSVHGIVVEGEDALHIDPASDHFEDPQPFDHVVYRESDMIWNKPEQSIVDTVMKGPQKTDEQSQQEKQNKDDETNNRSRRAIEYGPVSASDYVPGKDICHVALWADEKFVTQYGGAQGAIVKMLQRFSIMSEIFNTTTMDVDGTSMSPDIIVAQLTTDATNNLFTDAEESEITAKGYLERFSVTNTDQDRDWATFCLAHAFTYIDFSGTLGLAWTAFPDSENHNGGICQGQYRDPSNDDVSLNTAWTSSLNFGSTQPELQSALVLTHELGHNFGSQHDCKDNADVETCEKNEQDQAGGVFIMFPFAANGNDENNDKFSSSSKTQMAEAIRDRGGCFLDESEVAGVCGNFFKDDGEECDCGGSESLCSEIDPCCAADCSLASGKQCSPLDKQNGLCCTEDCEFEESSKVCAEQSECSAERTCNSNDGTCGAASNLADGTLCESGIAVCNGQCSSVCESGECTGSICSIWGMVECTVTAGEDACSFRCKPSGAAETECKATKDLLSTQMVRDAILADSTLVPQGTTDSDLYNKITFDVKVAGSSCEFLEGQPTSGICNGEVCLEADFEEDSLDELFREYEQLKETFNEWANEENYGLANKAWLAIGGVLLLLLCICMCYVTNREKKTLSG